MNIFLTGATGFVGAQLIKRLQNDHELYILYRDEAKKKKLIETLGSAHLHFIKGDITKPNCGVSLADAAAIPPIDYFYHLAALVKFDQDLREELFSINYNGTQHALDLAQQLNTQHFLYVSTAYTVGTEEFAKEEMHDLTISTNNPYEESKRQAEGLVLNAPMKTSILRPAIIIGDSKTGEADSKFTLYGFMKAVKLFKRKTVRQNDNRTYRLFGEDHCTSNLVPVDYVVTVLAAAINNAEDGSIYHITNNAPPKNKEILDLIKKHLDFEQLVVAPMKDIPTVRPEEAVLNGYIDVFAPYFKRSIIFDDSNTKNLLARTNQETLTLSHKELDHIISVYLNK